MSCSNITLLYFVAHDTPSYSPIAHEPPPPEPEPMAPVSVNVQIPAEAPPTQVSLPSFRNLY